MENNQRLMNPMSFTTVQRLTHTLLPPAFSFLGTLVAVTIHTIPAHIPCVHRSSLPIRSSISFTHYFPILRLPFFTFPLSYLLPTLQLFLLSLTPVSSKKSSAMRLPQKWRFTLALSWAGLVHDQIVVYFRLF